MTPDDRIPPRQDATYEDDRRPSWVDERMNEHGDALAGYLAWLHEQGLLEPDDAPRTWPVAGPAPAADVEGRGHDEMVDGYIADRIAGLPEGQAQAWADNQGDELLEFSLHLDLSGRMRADTDRITEPGPDTRDHLKFVQEYYIDQAVAAAENAAERCCSRPGCGC